MSTGHPHGNRLHQALDCDRGWLLRTLRRVDQRGRALSARQKRSVGWNLCVEGLLIVLAVLSAARFFLLLTAETALLYWNIIGAEHEFVALLRKLGFWSRLVCMAASWASGKRARRSACSPGFSSFPGPRPFSNAGRLRCGYPPSCRPASEKVHGSGRVGTWQECRMMR
jgi:hypothetical protein